MDIDFKNVNLSEEAAKLLATFMRLEYSLKMNDFCLASEAKANWESFAKCLGKKFFDEVRDSKKSENILKNPPQKQIVENGRLGWSKQSPPKNVNDLFVAVCRVRNNLVHGGKSGHPDNSQDDPDRNEKLISEAQWVLEHAICAKPDVKFDFEGNY